MSILINESFANSTTPVWGSGGGDPSTWSNYPAISDVDLGGNTLANGNVAIPSGYVACDNIEVNTINEATYGGQIAVGGPTNYELTILDHYPNGIGNGNIMNAGFGSALADPYNYVPDIISSAPQVPSSPLVVGNSTTLGPSGKADVSFGSPEIMLVQTDTSQQNWRVNFSISFTSDLNTPIGIYLRFGINNGDAYPFCQLFTDTNPFIISTTAGNLYTASFSDVFFFNYSIYNNIGNVNGPSWMSVNLINLNDVEGTTITNIKYLYTLEPCFQISFL